MRNMRSGLGIGLKSDGRQSSKGVGHLSYDDLASYYTELMVIL